MDGPHVRCGATHKYKPTQLKNKHVPDEHMARQFIQFGSFWFDAKQNVMRAGNIDFTANMSTKIIFRGVNFHKKMEEKKKRKYFYIGAMEVDVDEVMPT